MERPRIRLCGQATVDDTGNANVTTALCRFEPTPSFSLNIFSIFFFKADKVKWASDAARFFFSVSCQTFRRPGAAIWLFVEMSSNSTLGVLLNWFHLSATLGLASDLPATPPKTCPPPSPDTHTPAHLFPVELRM